MARENISISRYTDYHTTGCGVPLNDYYGKVRLLDCALRVKNEENCKNTFYYSPEAETCLCQMIDSQCARKPSSNINEYYLQSSMLYCNRNFRFFLLKILNAIFIDTTIYAFTIQTNRGGG